MTPARRTTIESLIVLAAGLIGVADGARLVYFKNPASIEDFTGPGRYLFVVSAMLVLAGACMLIFERSGPVSDIAEPEADRESGGKVVAIVAAMALYIFMIGLAGYLVASLIFFPLILRVMGIGFGPRMLLLAASMAIVFDLLFVRTFGMSLPKGMLFS